MKQGRSALVLVAIATTTALFATACGSDDGAEVAAATTEATEQQGPSQSPSPAPAEDEAAATAETLAAYFDGLDDMSEEGAEVMMQNASPGSPAALYAGFWGDGGRTPASFEASTRIDGDTAVLSSTAQDGTVTTTRYSQFEFDDDGLLVTWTSDPGGPLAPRIMAMNQTAERNGLSVEFSYAYESNSGDLAMPVRVVNYRADTGRVSAYTYIQPSGQQLDGRTFGANTTPFFAEVEGGAFLFDTFYVEGGELGGTALLEFDNDVQNPERVDLPSAAATN